MRHNTQLSASFDQSVLHIYFQSNQRNKTPTDIQGDKLLDHAATHLRLHSLELCIGNG